MKSIAIFTLSFLVTLTSFAQTGVFLPRRSLPAASVGAGIGRGAGQALSGWIEMRRSGEEFNQQIAEARSRHWELYPDKPGYAQALTEYEDLLLSKDINLMMQGLMTPDEWGKSLDGSLFGKSFKDYWLEQAGGGRRGGLDGGPLPGTRSYFYQWVGEMRKPFGGSSDELVANLILNPSSFLEAFNNALPSFEAYVYARGFAEWAQAGYSKEFYQSAEQVLVDATRFREMATGGTISVDDAWRQVQTSFEIYGRDTLLDATNVVWSNQMAGAFIVQKNGPAGLPVSDTQENAILFVMGPELTPRQYLLAMYRGLRAKSDRIDDLRIVQEFGEEAVLDACKEIRGTRRMPDAARRALARVLDGERIDSMGDTVLRFDREEIRDSGVPIMTIDFAGGGHWVGINSSEYYIRDADTGELKVAVIAPAMVRSAEINENHLILGAYDNAKRKNLAFVFDTANGSLLHTLEDASPDWRGNFGTDVALADEYAVVTGGDAMRHFRDVQTVVFDIETGEELRKIPYAGRIATDDNRLVIVGNVFNEEGLYESNPTGTIYNMDTGEEICRLDFSGVGARGFTPNNRDAAHVFDVEMDEGIVAVYLPNAAPRGTVVCFDSTTGEQLSRIVTRAEERRKLPQSHESSIGRDNKMELVGDRVLVWAQTGATEAESHHVFSALTGQPLRNFFVSGNRIEPYEGPLIFDGEHVVVRPLNRSIRIPLHQLEADAKDWDPLDDPGIKKRMAQPSGQGEVVLAAAKERERLRLIEEERIAAEKFAEAEARLDPSVFSSSELWALDRYARAKFYDMPLATEERSIASLERSITTFEKQHERFLKLPALRLEIHAYQQVIEENKKHLESSSPTRAKDTELLISWLQGKIDRANGQIAAGLARDDSQDLPQPLMGNLRRAAKSYAKELIYDLPRESDSTKLTQTIALIESMIGRNPSLLELPEAHLRLLATEAVVESLSGSERSWGDNPYHDPKRRDLANARAELPELQARWDAIRNGRSEEDLRPHNLEDLIGQSRVSVSKSEALENVVDGSGRRLNAKAAGEVAQQSKEPISRRSPAREDPEVVQVVEVDLGFVEFAGFQQALEIARKADKEELEEINQERADFGIESIDTYSRSTQWVQMAAGFWDLFAKTADSEHFDNAKDSIYKIRGLSSPFSRELKEALPFVYGRLNDEQTKRTPIGEIQANKIDEGELDPGNTVVIPASSERVDLLRELNSAEDDLRNRELVVARQTQTREVPERTLLSYQEQIEGRRDKVMAAEQALKSLDTELSQDG